MKSFGVAFELSLLWKSFGWHHQINPGWVNSSRDKSINEAHQMEVVSVKGYVELFLLSGEEVEVGSFAFFVEVDVEVWVVNGVDSSEELFLFVVGGVG